MFDPLLRRITGKSLPYVLHIIVEIAADVIVAHNDELIGLITNTWKSNWEHFESLVMSVGSSFNIKQEQITENMKKFRPVDSYDPQAIYSRDARAGLFLNKFKPDLVAGDEFNDEDRLSVLEMIALGEDIVRDEISNFIADCAKRIIDHSSKIVKFVSRLK
jgi:hypothetical protein